MLREHGIDWVGGDALGRFEGRRARAARSSPSRGRELPADMVVMGIGVVPDVMLARSAGLELGETGGIACSATLETSAPGVWAAGDACEYDSVVHGRRLRVEHWEVARAQGAAVAAAILGRRPSRSTRSPTSGRTSRTGARWSTSARRSDWDARWSRGSLDDGEFTIFYLAGGRVVARADGRAARTTSTARAS